MNTDLHPHKLSQVYAQIEFINFTTAQEKKIAIKNYIFSLYGSPENNSGSNIARGVFNKLVDLDKNLKIKESTTDERVEEGHAANQGKYEVFLDFTNESVDKYSEGYISETGEFVEYDMPLVFMHEVVHAIENLDDSFGFSSRNDAAGPTQTFTNNIHLELQAPLRTAYKGTAPIHEPDAEAPPGSIARGRQFTKDKLATGENPEITSLGVFTTFEEGDVDTSDNNPATNDLLIFRGSVDRKYTTGAGNDYLYGSRGNDTFDSGGDADYLNGSRGNDTLDGGAGEDVAEFSGKFKDYDYDKSDDSEIITLDHVRGFGVGEFNDGKDTLKNVEWAIFKDQRVPLGTSNGTDDSGNQNAIPESEPSTVTRLIPLPLEDGVEVTEVVQAADTTANPNPNNINIPPTISLTAPVSMLDGDLEYTLNISPYEPATEYNVVYIIDTSISIEPSELQVIKTAYTDLTNF